MRPVSWEYYFDLPINTHIHTDKMSNNKDNKTFEKLKQFFRINRGGPNLGEFPFNVCVPTIVVLLCLNFTGALRVKDDYTLTEDQGQRISSESSIHTRIKAIKELAEVAKSHRLEEVMLLHFFILLDCFWMLTDSNGSW